jgi:DNA-directed RNA polymerase specialized sigma subunit
MIRTESECKQALKERDAQRENLKRQAKALAESGLAGKQLELALSPLRTFHQELVDDIAFYEALRRGDMKAVSRLADLGQQLVALRIVKGLSQRELAKRLGVHESQVSRDERNEYHGITMDRAARILQALGLALVPKYVDVSVPA